MRLIPVLMLMACAGERVCDDEACQEVCAEQQRLAEAAVPEGGALLTAWERERLSDEIGELRRGLRIDPGSFGVCDRADACEEPLPLTPDQGLRPGPFSVRFRAMAPSVGAFALDVSLSCVTHEGDEVLARTDRVPVPHQPDGVWLDAVVGGVVEVPEGTSAVLCTLLAEPADGAPGVPFRGGWMVEPPGT